MKEYQTRVYNAIKQCLVPRPSVHHGSEHVLRRIRQSTHSLSMTRQVTASAAITFAVLTSSLHKKERDVEVKELLKSEKSLHCDSLQEIE